MDAKATGRLITERRKALGLSQAELAERLHVTDKAVSRWETGRGMPAIDSLEPLAEALGLSVSELLSGRELTGEELPKAAGGQIVETMRKNAGMVWRGVLATLLILVLLLGLLPAYHYVVSVPETDRAALEKRAAAYLDGFSKSDEWSFDYDTLRIVETERKGDYLAALCMDGGGNWCMCEYDRDELFPDRWRAAGGKPCLEEGKLGDWNFGTQREAVIILCGGGLPAEAAYYTFLNSGITYICPIQNRQVLDVFLLPDAEDIVSHGLELLDKDRQPLPKGGVEGSVASIS